MQNKITRELQVKVMFKASRHNDLLFAEAYENLIAFSKQRFHSDNLNSTLINNPISYQKQKVK